MINLKQGGALLFLALLALPARLHAAPSPFDIDVKELDRENPAVPPKAERKKTKKTRKEAPAAAAARVAGRVHRVAATGSGSEADYIRYTVKPGDHIFKILVGRLGMSNEAAERLIPEIIRVNNISNIKTLPVGRTLLIPGGDRQERAAKSGKPGRARHRRERGSEEAVLPAAGRLETPGVSSARGEAPGVQAAPQRKPAPPAPVASAPTSAASVPRTPKAAVAVAPTLAVPAPAAGTSATAASGATASVPAAPIVAAPAATPRRTVLGATPATVVPAPGAPAVTAPSAVAPTAALPAAAAPGAAAHAMATPPGNPAAPPLAFTWICSVAEKDPAKIVDSVMNALSLHWRRNRIIQSDEGAPNTFSIRVDRYFELNGVRYIVSIGENDPYSYTLLRLLEGAGYRVLTLNSGDDFKAVGEKLLRLVGLVPDFGRHVVLGGKESTGFLVQADDADGRRMVITSEAADPKLKWTLPAGCGIK